MSKVIERGVETEDAAGEGEWSSRVVLVGLGNVGSAVVPHLARLQSEVGSVTLIDPDIYESKNLFSQSIEVQDIGKPKVAVQLRVLHRINPRVQILALQKRAQEVPLGQLRGVIILGVDSRVSRLHMSRAAWRLGVPVIDAGVNGEALLARVNVYVPSKTGPCLECSWDEGTYRQLEEVYPCDPAGETGVAPTNAPTAIGALAASLQVLEARKLLRGERDQAAVGQEIFFECRRHHYTVTDLRRNPQCRFDHHTWSIESVSKSPDELSLGGALSLAGGSLDGSASLAVWGSHFVTRLTCRECSFEKPTLWVDSRIPKEEMNCPMCGGDMLKPGFFLRNRLTASDVTEADRDKPLASFGFGAGDVLCIGRDQGADSHFELAGKIEDAQEVPLVSVKACDRGGASNHA